MKHISQPAKHTFPLSRALPNIITISDEFPEIDTEGSIFIDPPKILLAEGNWRIQTLIMNMLSLIGCKVSLATDGSQAVNMATKKAYDIILMDIGLPRMDGIATIKAIRDQEPKHHPNVIIALTTYTDPVTKECEKIGINDFYAKPILMDELVNILKHWLPHLLISNNAH